MISRRVVAGIIALVAMRAVGGAADDGPCWEPPVTAPVRDPYRAPDCLWCAGNRGIEYNTAFGETVRAVAAGTVSFAGTVAGTEYVVVHHVDGRRATYGNLFAVSLAAGDPVVAGMRVGLAAGKFHFGLREGDRYIDPTPFLGRWVTRVRLVPVDGSPPRPAPPPRLACDSVSPMVLRR